MEALAEDMRHYRAGVLDHIGGPEPYRQAYQLKLWGQNGGSHVLSITIEEFQAIRAILTREGQEGAGHGA